jgi:hypothetical protein|tara:strand:+ start:792 stop:989 length:198 start_codon:yes stop_codon:yes gene_type:complete
MGLALVVMSMLFFNNNAEFLEAIDSPKNADKEWTYVGSQVRDPNELAIPLVNEETGEETILFRLQ